LSFIDRLTFLSAPADDVGNVDTGFEHDEARELWKTLHKLKVKVPTKTWC
jgi:ATP-dependent DNA ligase